MARKPQSKSRAPAAPRFRKVAHTQPSGLTPAPIDAGSLMMRGIQLRLEAERIEAVDKAGVLRGGSAGLVLEDGRVGAGCVRASHARFLGGEPDRGPGEWELKQLMFEAGNFNEDAWAANIRSALLSDLPGYSLLREEEFPIEWRIGSTPGTGREDLVLVDSNGTPIQLVELKLVSSLGTALESLAEVSPKPDAAVQLVNYMYRSGLPGQVWYTNRFDVPVPEWKFALEVLPKSQTEVAHPAAPFLQWSRGYTRKSGEYVPPKPTKIKQFVVGFDFAFDGDGRMWFREVGATGDWTRTVVTKSGIDEFYRRTVALPEEGLGDRPAVVELDGRAGTFRKCDYCDWASTCDDAEASSRDPKEQYEVFRDLVQATIPDTTPKTNEPAAS